METQNTSLAVGNGIFEMLEQIKNISAIDEIIAYIKKIDALKVALEAVDTFRQQSIMYAKLEANALIRAVELGGLNKLKGYHKATAEWLYGLNDIEKEKYISMCEHGLTIDNVYKREVSDIKKLDKNIEQIKYERNCLIQECKKNGIIEINSFSDMVKDKLKYDKREIAEDIIDGTRKRLRDAGAVGIGNDSGIYVMPRPENSDEIKKAILLRYNSIIDDFERIREILKTSKIKMSYKDFDNGSHFSYISHSYVPHILLAFCSMKIISDEKELSDAISRSDFYKECDYFNKILNISRKDYIKQQYKNYFGESKNIDD